MSKGNIIVRADEILLAIQKHSINQNCFFTTRCKSGPTWDILREIGGTQERYYEFDGLSVARSWRNFCITIYEVKVSRHDFLRDTKWPEYRAFCHRLYFACPEHLIEKDELPDDIGLMWYNPERRTVRVVRTGKHRDITVSWQLLAAIIFSHLQPDRHPFFTDDREFWERWVEQGKLDRDLAFRVRGKLRDVIWEIAQKEERLQRREEELENKLKAWNRMKDVLEEFGIYVEPCSHGDGFWGEGELRNRLQGNVSDVVRRLARQIQELAVRLERVTTPKKEVSA